MELLYYMLSTHILIAIILIFILLVLIVRYLLVFILTSRPKLQAIMKEGKLSACPHNGSRLFTKGNILCDMCGAKIGVIGKGKKI